MNKNHYFRIRGLLILLTCALFVGLLLGTSGAAAVNCDEVAFEALNMECVGSLDIEFGATYSKLDAKGRTDGHYLYSGCYLPDRCFRTVDVRDPYNPVQLATVDTYDPVESPAPPLDTPAGAAVWYSDKYNDLPIEVPCGDWNDPDIVNGTKEPTCWDPGWNTHSHYVQESRNILVANQERYRTADTSKRASFAGLTIWDVHDPANPVFLSRVDVPKGPRLPNGTFTQAGGVHHFFFDGRYVYMGAPHAGFFDRVLIIVDLLDPENPVIASKWWVPGQKTPEEDDIRDWVPLRGFAGVMPVIPVGSEGMLRKGVGLHYAYVQGNRAYLSYHHGGVIILNVSDKRDPQMISRLDYFTPEYAVESPNNEVCIAESGEGAICGNTHAAKPVPGHNLLVVSDEYFRCPYGHVRIVDISDETNPEIISHFYYPENFDCDAEWPASTPSSHLGTAKNSHLYFMAWFGFGLRAIDLSNPYEPVEAGYYIYENSEEVAGCETYDINLGPGGFLYVSDNTDGLRVLKYTGQSKK